MYSLHTMPRSMNHVLFGNCSRYEKFACCEKTRMVILVFSVQKLRMRTTSLRPNMNAYTCSANNVRKRAAARHADSADQVTYHVHIKMTRIIPLRSVWSDTSYIAQKTSEIVGGVSKNHAERRWVFRFGFFGVFRGSMPSNLSTEKPECENRLPGFFTDAQCMNGLFETHWLGIGAPATCVYKSVWFIA